MPKRRLLTPLLFIVILAVGGMAVTVATDSSPELGLDLQGGVSVLLTPTGDASDEQLDQALEIIRTRVDALGVAEPEISRQGNAIDVQLPGVRNRDRALELVGQTAELRFRPVLATAPAPGEDTGDTTTDTTAAPGDTTGTTAAPGDTTGTTAAPGDTTATTAAPDDTTATSEGAAAVVGSGDAGIPLGESALGRLPSQEDPTTTTSVPEATTTTVAGEEPAAEPPPTDASGLTPRDEDEAEATVTLADEEGAVYQLGPTFEVDGRQTTGRIVSSASAKLENGQWIVGLTMRGGAEGIDLFNGLAAECFNRTATCPTGSVAIVLDSVVQSAPNISQPSYERDRLSISGSFDESSAKDLALVLRYGSLPVELERQEVNTVSAALGEDSLRAGVVAGVVGLALVVLYMILYYRALGVVVLLGLTVWGSLTYAIISWLGETRGLALTLAGVTGIIVSIGVTVDSYVVFFERLKDEVKAGRTLRSSTDRAFRRAYRTILAADISSFMGAAILWWLTVGSVRGFAFFLGLSTVLDVAVAWFFTRPMVTFLARSRVFTDMPYLGVARGLAAEPVEAPPRGRAAATPVGAAR